MSEGTAAPDFRGLENDYEISGELRGSDSARHYIGRSKAGSAGDVLITVVNAPNGGENNALSHFAADAQILASNTHPTISRVRDGRWIGKDSFALVSDRIYGETLDEQLERGERFSNPKVALALQDVSGALDWARESGVVHRGVTPDSVFFDRGSNGVRITFSPTPIPITGVPDACADARTIGMLGWAFLTGKPYAKGETRSLGEVAPNLATRVIDATDKLIRCKDHEDAPDVGTYLGILAAGDVLKQAEVELAAQKEEYDEEHAKALQACEVRREETEQHAAEQAAILAGEREEFQRMMADERAAFEAERKQLEALLEERKERLGAVRAELDQQRTELERRLAELEEYRLSVEKLRDDALTAREEAKVAASKASEAAAAHQAAVKAAEAAAARAAAEAASLNAARQAIPTDIDAAASDAREKVVSSSMDIPAATKVVDLADVPADKVRPAAAPPVISPVEMAPIPTLAPFTTPKLAKPPKPPKWKKIERVDLEHTDNVTVEDIQGGRPRWLVPSGIGALLLIVAVALFGLTHHTPKPGNTVRLGNQTVVPTPPSNPTGIVPRGGFLTQSAGGSLSPKFNGSPVLPGDSLNRPRTDSVAAATTAAATVHNQAQVDSAAAAVKRRAERAADAKRSRSDVTQEMMDNIYSPTRVPRARPDSVAPRPDVTTPRPDTVVRRDTVKRDLLLRPDTTVRRDSIRPDTATVRS